MSFARSTCAVTLALAALTACSFQNKYEREADRITRAVMDNNLTPVQGDLAPNVKLTRVQVAAWSDELDAQGKLLSLKETTTNCSSGYHCFDVKFEKHAYVEMLAMDDRGKVTEWRFHMAAPAGNS
jgi:hypothetical protein